MLIDQKGNAVQIVYNGFSSRDQASSQQDPLKTTDGIEFSKVYLMEYQILPDGIKPISKTARFVRKGGQIIKSLPLGISHVMQMNEQGYFDYQKFDALHALRHLSKTVVTIYSNFKIFGASPKVRSKLRKQYDPGLVKAIFKYVKGRAENGLIEFVALMIDCYMWFKIPKTSDYDSVLIKDSETAPKKWVDEQIGLIGSDPHITRMFEDVYYSDLDEMRDALSNGLIKSEFFYSDLNTIAA